MIIVPHAMRRTSLRSLLAFAVVAGVGLTHTEPVQAFDDSGQSPLPIEQRAYQRYERFSPAPTDGARLFYTYGISATPGFVNPVGYLLNRTKRTLCPELEPRCYGPGDTLEALGYLPLCSKSTQSLCIRRVLAKKDDGDWVVGKVIGTVDLTPKQSQLDQVRRGFENSQADQVMLEDNRIVSWAGNTDVPASASGSLKVEFPGVSNAAGAVTYVIKSIYEFTRVGSVSRFTDFFTNVIPYVAADRPDADTSVRHMIGSKTDKNSLVMGQAGATGDATKFAWSEYGRLGYAAAFAPGTRFRVELQLPDALGGWFHGRINDPLIELTSIDGKTNLFSVEAAPANVPVTSAWVPAFDNGQWSPYVRDVNQWIVEAASAGNFGAFGPIWEPNAGLSDFNRHLPMLGDRARGQASVWSIASIQNLGAAAPPCLNKPNTFQGLVTTDSMVYQPGIPIFVDGFLKYQVAGVHMNWEDEVIRGSYNLILRSDSARCLYGFSKAPLSATISVLDDKGETIVAATVVSEKDGWLKLTATGFTFSQKTISVKLTQRPTSPKTTTLICFKGKTVRKVTAVKPKCPIGFRKR
jgi:hypothetical protein